MRPLLATWLAVALPLFAANPAAAENGRILPTFNNGRPAVDLVNTQAFYTGVSRNLGPQLSGQTHGIAAAALTPSGLVGLQVQTVLGVDGVQVLGGGLPALAESERALFDSLPAIVIGVQTTGEYGVMAANHRRSDGTVQVRVHALKWKSAEPPTLAATRDLTPAGESEEATDLRVDGVDGSNAKPTATVHVASAKRVSNDCYAPTYAQLLLDPQTGGLVPVSSNGQPAYTPAPFSQCHTRFAQLRLDPATGGLTPVPSPRQLAARTVRSIVMAVRCRETPTSPEQACLYKLRHDGVTIGLDTSFGGDGQVIVRAADPTLPLRLWSHEIDDHGRVLVAYGLGRADGSYVPVILRLRADGTLDTSFVGGGAAAIPTTGLSTNPRTLTRDINGNIQVSGETYTASSVRPFVFFLNKSSAPGAAETYTPQLVEYALANYPNSAFFAHVREPDGTITAVGTAYLSYPDTATMRPLVVRLEGPPAAQPAIEYFNAGFGHHISVVNPVEIGKLDSGEFVGWARTGYFFNVYPIGTPGTSAVDRFFTTAFPPKSSHVFSANAAESADIKQDPVWQFEGPVFGARLPSADGTCPLDTRRVSRVYNNGLTGAPNHRFADDADVVAQATSTGTLEGAGPKGAFYCTE